MLFRWPMTGDRQAPVPTPLPFWLKPSRYDERKSIFSLFYVTTFIASSLSLALPPTIAPTRLMLAGTPSPRSSGARLAIYIALTEGCFVRGRFLSGDRATGGPSRYRRWDGGSCQHLLCSRTIT